jgi:hypothetical protein
MLSSCCGFLLPPFLPLPPKLTRARAHALPVVLASNPADSHSLRASTDPLLCSVRFMMEHFKKCPRCGNFIEKNQGCKHMTCQKAAGGCGFEVGVACLSLVGWS